ncbi:MAG: sulfurtransferase TusA family protein [Alphaproteobacteria bacterium]|nr:sulfurtransferase TusA family protein [Alphaproteobacteria bacterium]
MEKAELDATGLKCPLPVLKARKAMKSLASGGVLVVRATDPGSPADMRAFCESQGHEMTVSDETDGVFTFEIRKG